MLKLSRKTQATALSTTIWIVAFTSVASAQQGTATLTNPLKNIDSIGALVQTFIEIASYLAVIAAVLLLIWVGLQFVLARGNAKRMGELKDWLFWIMVGVAVIIGARIIIQIIINTLSATGVVDQGVIQSADRAAQGR